MNTDNTQGGAEPTPASDGSTFFRAGDVVHHAPSGEDWVLATDEDDGGVYPMGWPSCRAKASDCRMVTRATDDQRYEVLRSVASILSTVPDERIRVAARQMKAARDLGHEST
jgi:hypothetical protein